MNTIGFIFFIGFAVMSVFAFISIIHGARNLRRQTKNGLKYARI